MKLTDTHRNSAPWPGRRPFSAARPSALSPAELARRAPPLPRRLPPSPPAPGPRRPRACARDPPALWPACLEVVVALRVVVVVQQPAPRGAARRCGRCAARALIGRRRAKHVTVVLPPAGAQAWAQAQPRLHPALMLHGASTAKSTHPARRVIARHPTRSRQRCTGSCRVSAERSGRPADSSTWGPAWSANMSRPASGGRAACTATRRASSDAESRSVAGREAAPAGLASSPPSPGPPAPTPAPPAAAAAAAASRRVCHSSAPCASARAAPAASSSSSEPLSSPARCAAARDAGVRAAQDHAAAGALHGCERAAAQLPPWAAVSGRGRCWHMHASAARLHARACLSSGVRGPAPAQTQSAAAQARWSPARHQET